MHVVIATPGRILDLMKKGTAKVDSDGLGGFYSGISGFNFILLAVLDGITNISLFGQINCCRRTLWSSLKMLLASCQRNVRSYFTLQLSLSA